MKHFFPYIFKYFAILLIYLFLFSVIKDVYMESKFTKRKRKKPSKKYPYLKSINLKKYQKEYIIDEDITIGRWGCNNIIIKDDSISNIHVKIFYNSDNSCYISDLESKEGTYINDIRIHSLAMIPVKKGDKIKLGNIEFILLYQEE